VNAKSHPKPIQQRLSLICGANAVGARLATSATWSGLLRSGRAREERLWDTPENRNHPKVTGLVPILFR
jgi:hypothetical protein